MKKYKHIKKILVFFALSLFLCNVSSNITYAEERSVTVNDQEYQLNIVKQGAVNKCTFVDENSQEHTVEYFQETGKLYLDNKLIASSTDDEQSIETTPGKFYARSSTSAWSPWKTVYSRDGNSNLDSLTVSAIMAVLGMLAGTVGSAVLGIATAVATYKDHIVYYRQWVQKRYSKYNTTQTRTITQFYRDKAHKKPIGNKVYSKPILS